MISLKTLWIILPLITASCAYEVCYKRSYGSSVRQLYCSDSCCGTSYSRYCCTRYSYTGIYTGSGFGTVGLIAIIVTCICCCRRRQAQHGRLMTTNQLAVVSTSNVASL
ncbi:uncharacterized protein LOC124276056 [Haliotis rubra]|uniref:uncharacterized protein LOC124276056 n=1 Tax=Haliotis rubra TaxID=36100 RepID=UPI001EE61A13|nr:uncharacterized protein LOC124276056 [Haliotis rubra]